MGEARVIVEELLVLCLQRITMEESSVSTELEMVELVRSLEAARRRWLGAELELKKYKELLVKSDVSKAALEVKLKHARNQLDVEMKKRYKVEGDYQYLRQMQLMCDILVHDSKSSACLNAEQKSLLATFDHRGANMTLHRSKRLTVIDESSFMSVCHSDISYDRTDDDVDLDTSVIKPLRSRARERRRSSMGPGLGSLAGKRGKGGVVSAAPPERKAVDKEVETTVKASVVTPEAGGQAHGGVGTPQETPTSTRNLNLEGGQSSRRSQVGRLAGSGDSDACASDQTSVWFTCEEAAPVPEADAQPKMEDRAENLRHVFLSKTVIRPETCSPCGKRIRFGKMAVKCRNCRVVAHPECKQKVTGSCTTSGPAGGAAQQNSLDGFAPAVHPKVPLLVVQCVAEIERRGLEERGLYRVPGGERLVKELRDRFVQGKAPLLLSKVHDIHVVCGLLKDFLRKLKEPLLTFRLHRTFMEAAEVADEDNSAVILYQAIAELPQTNRDTLAFLMLHLHKVMKSPHCQMDQNNLARVFGPTLVGHGMSEPSPTTIMKDTNTQPKVVSRLLALPDAYWRSVLSIQTNQTTPIQSQDSGHGRLFKPLTSPELNSYYQTASRGSLRGRIRNLGGALPNTGRVEQGKRFFTSPS
ncbi:rac GTPase-activating protein 1 isoform X2 [Antennarius striatus]|uniref:rac GTPase-activating protein 1 isoform X2 n=1 Tax=Antennarius striatus TaxID=241820 RepID=UPI0035AECC0C